jgi:hypothetical protein
MKKRFFKYLFIIIMVPAFLALLIPFIATFLQEPPTRLPSPPANTVSILDIETWSSGDTFPIIRTADGMVCEYNRFYSPEIGWIIFDEPYYHPIKIDIEDCGKSDIRRFKEIGKDVVSCKKNKAYKYFCLGQIAVYAVDTDGNIWLSNKNFFCPNLAIFLFVVMLVPCAVIILIIWSIIGFGKSVFEKFHPPK